MYIGKVVGNVVSTKKEESLTGYKLMIVERIQRSNQEKLEEIVAVDLVGAGRGEFVLIVKGSSARMAAKNQEAPIDATIVGIIDTFDD
ncbi:ethanolamine utilization protein EutN [Enterococcus florum]|uniref:Ethanolamine utilization protein EutN n=1 Tax=Enterococcus florum TaxID=2480627 RepID=A0A4P5P5L0_9ENTE|nr:EutN/CcmL family microcompartment protein [Enterococcus florum]GCF93137.1 ethanolamine utilization protein EutN [Enterococcus florum]